MSHSLHTSPLFGQSGKATVPAAVSSRRLISMFDWLFGAAPPARFAASPVFGAQRPEPDPLDPMFDQWVDGFNAALTEGATSFILRHVAPYHNEDPEAGYRIKRVKVGFKDAATPCLRAIQSMPAEMRDRIVLLRIKKAKGAEQLDLSQFYGLSIVAEDSMMEGQLVETLVSYSGARFALKFEFEGEYTTLPLREPLASPAVAQAPEATPTPAATPTPTATPSPAHGAVTEPAPQAPVSPVVPPTAPPAASFDAFSRETPLATRPIAPAPATLGGETPLYRSSQPQRSPIARLHLCAAGVQASVDLFEDGFPYTIGRHPDLPGFAVRPRNFSPSHADRGLLAQTQAPGTLCYVSREHLSLQLPDLAASEIRIDNLAAQRGRNGVYCKGVVQPQRFIHRLGAAHSLSLGAASGDGILEIKVEKA